MKNARMAVLVMVVVLLAVVNAALASVDTFGTGGNQFTIDFVDISGDTKPGMDLSARGRLQKVESPLFVEKKHLCFGAKQLRMGNLLKERVSAMRSRGKEHFASNHNDNPTRTFGFISQTLQLYLYRNQIIFPERRMGR